MPVYTAVSRVAEIRAGSVRAAARLITEIENGRASARPDLQTLLPDCGGARLVGLTGPPGAGKSTLAAALIAELRGRGHTVGVIAVDPSSPFSGGALLGDRDRMLEASSRDADVFIRSLAARGVSGGLAAAVNDTVDVLDAMGKDVILIETVGVGQGELDIAAIAHTVVLVLVPGYGDSLQAMKAGITEIADVVVVNKADTPGAEQTARELAAEGFTRRGPDGVIWSVPVLAASARRGEGVADLVDAIDAHHAQLVSTGWKSQRESDRRRGQFLAHVATRLRHELAARDSESWAPDHTTDPYGAAARFVAEILPDDRTTEPRDV